ncbi:NlpC/P60 family protein (plasmid) [Streptomyces sp. NBC_01220]|uniref:C40 family peptidase n=1 Tax=Streptomyces sp. NBC_01220 TaxID=2903781 RepID=UPI00352CCA35|nr:NlpC/P60 family protein [Streptomyces sp. NBC_01220]
MKAWRKLGCLGAVLLVCAMGCAGPAVTFMNAASLLSKRTQAGGEPVGSVAGINDRMLTAYESAAAAVGEVVPKCRGMRWQILAGIARIESNHASGHDVAANGDITPHILGPVLNGSGVGGNTTSFSDTDSGRWDGDSVYERAVGPFQFLPATFRGSGRDANGDGRIDPHNADDAALGAAVYLCGSGRNLGDEAQLRKAVYAYNHSDAYVADVLGWIDRYDAAGSQGDLGKVTGTVRTVLAAALAQKGVPYVWGGGSTKGPSRGSCCSPSGQDGSLLTGFDCSGLTLYAFAQAGVKLPRTADVQAGVGTRIPASSGVRALKPGDLVFYGYLPTVNSSIHHVGIYLGNGQMINAARPGTRVRVDPISALPDYAGGARVL